MTEERANAERSAEHPQIDALLAAAGRSGHYRVVSEVGWGGFGIVYKALDVRLNRAVAIKAIHRSRLVDARVTSRLRTEALAAASLDHPYICKIYELIESGNDNLIVMEYVEGETLRTHLRRGLLPIEKTVELAIEIAEGLANAHERGLVHRDLKPANVMLTPHGHIKLLDFGMALEDATSTPSDETQVRATPTDAYAGTPHYMAPEQAAGRQVTARADLFSFGVVLFECVTGQLPFKGTNPYEYVSHLMSHSATPVHYLAPHAPAELAELIDRCLDKTPARRPESAAEVVRILQRLSDAMSASGHTLRSVSAARREARWRWVVAGAVAIGALALVWWMYPRAGLRDRLWSSRPLVTSAGEKADSRISPDGQWISFLSVVGGATQLFVQRISEGEPQRATIPTGTVQSQTWSPDGSQLIYALKQGGAMLIQIVPAFFGGTPTITVPVTPTPTTVNVLRWIDRTVYLDLSERRGRSLARLDLDAGTIASVSDGWKVTGAFRGFDVRPDGKRVAFSLLSSGQEDLWTANLDGSSMTRLTNDTFFERRPLWSGSGQSIVYQSNRGGQVDLWEISPETRAIRQLTSSQTVEEPESTSADGARVSFLQVSRTANLWRWDPASGAARQLTNDSLSDYSPAVQAGGAQVVFQRTRPSVASDPVFDSTLFVGTLTGPGSSPLPRALTDGFAAKLSPDGTHVAFLQRNADPLRASLVLRNLATNATVTISTTCPRPAYSNNPVIELAQLNIAWHPSGREFYFVDWQDSWTVRRHRIGASAGGPPLVTAKEGQSLHDLQVSGDGQLIAYVLFASGTSEVHVLETNTGADRVVATFQGAAYPRGWLTGDAALVVARSVAINEDFTAQIEVALISRTGSVRRAGLIERGFIATTRWDPSRGMLYLTRVEGGVHNLFGLPIGTGSLRAVTDNSTPGVTFSGIEPLGGGPILGVRDERQSDIWLMEADAVR